MLRPLSLLAFGVFLPLSQAQFVAGDDFGDPQTDQKLWGTDRAISGSGVLTETNQRLQYTVEGTPSETDLVVRPWVLNVFKVAENWEFFADVNVPTAIAEGQRIYIGLVVAAGDLSSNNFLIELGHGSARTFRSFFRANGVRSPNVEVQTAATRASVRIAFEAATRTISAYYDPTGSGDGYTWTLLRSEPIGSNWSLDQRGSLTAAIIGDSSMAAVTAGDQVFIDNFRATTASAPRADTARAAVANEAGQIEIGGGISSSQQNFLAPYRAGAAATAQLMSPDGAKLGAPIPLGASGSMPNSAYGGGVYVVCWMPEITAAGGGWKLFAQALSIQGAKSGEPFEVLASISSHALSQLPAIASDGADFLLLSHMGTTGSVYGQFLRQSGSALDPEFYLGGANARDVTVTYGGGQFLVCMETREIVSSVYDVIGVFVSPAGVVGTPFRISQIQSPRHNPLAISYDGRNFAVIYNIDIGPGGAVPPTWRLYGRVVTPAGTFLGPEKLIVSDHSLVPFMAFDGSRHLLTWGQNLNIQNATRDIRCRYLDTNLDPVGPTISLFASQGADQPCFGALAFDGERFGAIGNIGRPDLDATGSLRGFLNMDTHLAIIPKSNAPPKLTATKGDSNNLLIETLCAPGINYLWETKSDLADAAWIEWRREDALTGTLRASCEMIGPKAFVRVRPY